MTVWRIIFEDKEEAISVSIGGFATMAGAAKVADQILLAIGNPARFYDRIDIVAEVV